MNWERAGATLIATALSAFVLYEIAMSLTTDVEVRAIASLGGIDQCDVLLWSYSLLLWIVAGIAIGAIYHDARAIAAWGMAGLVTAGIVAFVSAVSLYYYPNFTLGPGNVFLLNALWAVYVLKNPATYLIMVAVLLAGTQVACTALVGAVTRR
jgi:hypothetical protein